MKITLVSAQWCSQCKGMKDVLNQLNIDYSTVDIDSEEGSAFAQQHRIRSLPTVCITNPNAHTMYVVGIKPKNFWEDFLKEFDIE